MHWLRAALIGAGITLGVAAAQGQVEPVAPAVPPVTAMPPAVIAPVQPVLAPVPASISPAPSVSSAPPPPPVARPSVPNAGAAAASVTAIRRARISGGVMAGQLLTKVNPVYPPDAKASGVSGIVVLHAIIGKDGNVYQLTAVSGPPVLAAAAVDAVRQWTYKPYLLNGNPVEVDTTITVNFNLNRPPPPSQP